MRVVNTRSVTGTFTPRGRRGRSYVGQAFQPDSSVSEPRGRPGIARGERGSRSDTREPLVPRPGAQPGEASRPSDQGLTDSLRPSRSALAIDGRPSGAQREEESGW